MEEKISQPVEIFELDLVRYGLDHLRGRNILELNEPDLDDMLLALGNDDISLIVPVACTPENVNEILSYSECRRCGRCCIPNPLNPENPGVQITQDELQALAEYVREPFNAIWDNTKRGEIVPNPFQFTRLEVTRWLPLPCPFHTENPDGCRAHKVRPLVCRVHPIVFTGDPSNIYIKTNCGYGKDIIKAAYRKAKNSDPSLEIKL